jgi:hypothetical protein
MARDLRYPMRYGQSYSRKRAVQRIVIDLDGSRHPVDLVFPPYQSLLVRASRTDGVQFVDIGYLPPAPVR